MERCSWVAHQCELYQRYHDEEWGVPVHEDGLLFEMLILESFHTGLSWLIILKKREAFKEAFDFFDAQKIALYKEEKVQELLQNEKIVRSEAKIRATITNAQVFIAIQKEFGSFEKYLWGFTSGKVLYQKDTKPTSELSDLLSKDLKKRGFKFMGSVTMHAYLQAVGVVCAHEPQCFRNQEG